MQQWSKPPAVISMFLTPRNSKKHEEFMKTIVMLVFCDFAFGTRNYLEGTDFHFSWFHDKEREIR